VLAALDLAGQTPDFSKIAERLRIASASPQEAVRGRAALVYALVRSDQIPAAEAELAKLESDEHQHPLLEELKAFVTRFKTVSKDAGADAAASAVDPTKLPALDTSPNAESSSTKEPPAGDFRQRLVQAANAVHSGDLGRAETLYQGVLNEQPGSTEALSGLADVAKRRGDSATAARLYQRVLDSNPTYLPAVIATADAKWDSGDRKGAVVLYRRVLEQAGQGSDYGQRAAARIAEADRASASSSTAPTSTSPSTPAPAPAPSAAPPSTPAPQAPGIDTSDLPGFK
jgi:tetratricopeptide (TPR) repeat protein